MPSTAPFTREMFKNRLQRFLQHARVKVYLRPHAVQLRDDEKTGKRYTAITYAKLDFIEHPSLIRLAPRTRRAPLESLLAPEGEIARMVIRHEHWDQLFAAYNLFQNAADRAHAFIEKYRSVKTPPSQIEKLATAQATTLRRYALKDSSSHQSAELMFESAALLASFTDPRSIRRAADRFMEAAALAHGHDAKALIMEQAADTLQRVVRGAAGERDVWTWEHYRDHTTAHWREALKGEPDALADPLRIFMGYTQWLIRPSLTIDMHTFLTRSCQLNQEARRYAEVAEDHLRLAWATLYAVDTNKPMMCMDWPHIADHLKFAVRIWRDIPKRRSNVIGLRRFADAANEFARTC